MKKIVAILFFVVVSTSFSNVVYIDIGLGRVRNENNSKFLPMENGVGGSLSATKYFKKIESLNTDLGVGVRYISKNEKNHYTEGDFRYNGLSFDNAPIFVSFKTRVYKHKNLHISVKGDVGVSFNINEDSYTIDKRVKKPILGEFYYYEWSEFHNEKVDIKNGMYYAVSMLIENEYVHGGVSYSVADAKCKIKDRDFDLKRGMYGIFMGIHF